MATWVKRHLRIVLLLLSGVVLLPAYLRAFRLITPSETPSINIGDTVLVNEAAYTLRLPFSDVRLFRTGTIRRGDMVQLLLPDGPAHEHLAVLQRWRERGFKRVIGLPGESVEIRDNCVLVNGRALPLQPLKQADFAWVPAINHIGSTVANEDGHWISFTPGEGQYRNYPSVRLGPRQYFLIGDNRDVSADSRIWGPVSEDRILGKVIATIRQDRSQ